MTRPIDTVRDWIGSYRTTDRAVSRQVGIAIAAAVVVVIAVVGVFVLQGGIGGGPGPDATIEAEQTEQDLNTGARTGSSCKGDDLEGASCGMIYVKRNVVTFEHAGGEELAEDEIIVRAHVVNGSESVDGWAFTTNNSSDLGVGGDGDMSGSGAISDDVLRISDGGWNERDNETIRSSDTASYSEYISDRAADHWKNDAEVEMTPREFVANELPGPNGGCAVSPAGFGKYFGSPEHGYGQMVDADHWAVQGLYVRDNGHDASDCENAHFGESGMSQWDEAGGFLTAGDRVNVTWSPPATNQSAVLKTHELS